MRIRYGSSALLLTIGLTTAVALIGCQRQSSDAAGMVRNVSGVLVLAPGQSMPAGMPLEVELAELSTAKQPPAPIAVARLESGDAAETPFTLQFESGKVQSGRPYVLRARAAIQGNAYLAGNSLAPVDVEGMAFPVDVVLRRPEHASPLYLDVSVLRLEYKGDADWSGKLRDVMPGILACLRSVSGQGLRVTRAWSMSGGLVGVRIRADDGNGFDCRALADGSKFESLSGLPSFAVALPGEGNPEFVPAPASPKMANVVATSGCSAASTRPSAGSCTTPARRRTHLGQAPHRRAAPQRDNQPVRQPTPSWMA